MFLRMQFGASGTWLSPASKTRLNGFGDAIDLEVGAALTPWLVLAGTFTHAAGSLKASKASNPPTQHAIVIGFGPAMVYCLPANFFLGAAVGGSRMQFADTTTTWKTGLGLMVKAEAGKEWWLSDNWSLGGSLRYFYMRAKESEAGPYAPVWDAHGISLLLSATYN